MTIQKPTRDQVVTALVATAVVGAGVAVFLQDRQVKKVLKGNLEATAELAKRVTEMEATILSDSDGLKKYHKELSEVNRRMIDTMSTLVSEPKGKEG